MNLLLLKPHTHAGIDHPPGARIDLADDLAAWLIAAGVAKKAAIDRQSSDKSPQTPHFKGV